MMLQQQSATARCRSSRAGCSGRAAAPYRGRLIHCAASTQQHDKNSTEPSPIDNIDALLGSAEDPQLHPDQQLVPWWQLKPKQAAPPRQTLLHPPGEVARFVADQALYATKVRSGKSTQMGGELDIPQVDPYFCYLIMATQLAVYAAGTWLAVAQGPDAAEAMARELAMQPKEVLASGESWRLFTSLLLHGGITHLALDTLFLGFMGPGIEALLGHSVFIYIYLISGLAGSSSVLLFSDSPDPISCATAATVGLIGGMVGYELANMEIVKKSLASRRSKAEDGKQGSSTLRKPWGTVGIVGLMLGLGLLPGSMVDNTAHVGGLLTGLALGYLMGPRFTLVQEVDIPVGSMMVPDDCPATQVVLDRRTGLERALVGAGAVGLLAGVLIVGSAARGTLG